MQQTTYVPFAGITHIEPRAQAVRLKQFLAAVLSTKKVNPHWPADFWANWAIPEGSLHSHNEHRRKSMVDNMRPKVPVGAGAKAGGKGKKDKKGKGKKDKGAPPAGGGTQG